MKKIISLVLLITLVMASAVVYADAQSINVKVTICVSSQNVPVKLETVKVEDPDNDGIFTINDALYCAHEQLFEGGAEAGYATAVSQYGLGLVKLWGIDAQGNYLYYVNHTSPNSLADQIHDGDYVYALVINDTVAYSDTYTWFDKTEAEVKVGEELTLTLSQLGFDPTDWSPVSSPLGDAVITVDSQRTQVKTDADGNATITINEAGDHIISAESDTKIISAPLVKVSVKANDTLDDNSNNDLTTGETTGVEDTVGEVAPVTADFSAVFAGLAVVFLAVTLGLKTKKKSI